MFLKRFRRPQWLSSLVGGALCAATAFVAALIFNRSSSKALVPLIFLFVILLAAMRFGSAAGILGTMTAAVIFALFMFEPFLRLGINDSVQKSNLIWMVVGGLALSDLFGRQPDTVQKQVNTTDKGGRNIGAGKG
jgi:K+-sensing histidine kinase KdpD